MAAKVQLLITLALDDELVARIRSVSPRIQATVRPAGSADEIGRKQWESAEVLYTGNILPEADWAPALRWIQFNSAGVDRVIEAPILQKKGLIATSLSGANSAQVAEYVLMMLLALGHHLPALIDYQRQSEWPKNRWKRFGPREMSQSTVGIVGYGSIGRQIARLLSGFGATVLAVKRNAMRPADEGYTPHSQGDPEGDLVHRLYPPQALRAMLKECDFVVLALPYTPETHHSIGAEELGSMKPDAYLVDISRGNILDHQALIRALESGQIAGAALDVFPEEPLPKESPLWGLPNVILTPHLSGITPYYDQRGVALFIENLNRYLADQPLLNQIDLQRGY
ncbi:MAG TPA: D-2-hydroxyacid dehydrogenase [Anaerolineales bacterium]|nr:D-2-hydroxyacid dehydrogenase [Anaerolineales bacterium]